MKKEYCNMANIAIVAIAYNKAKSLQRLLNSLNGAEYGEDEIPLIISIDNSGSNVVEKMAEEFEWKHGEKRIRTFQERQGLQKHILSCGDFLETYDAVYIFEDDIIVSPYYYQFGKKCIEKYKDNSEIEGISLYSPKWNQNVNFPFEPLKSKYDVYFMKYAQSLGQIWFREKWQKFKKWYVENGNFFEREKSPLVPGILYTWGQHSWLKYHIAYCALHGGYFVYPYYSFTSSFVEDGTHFVADITRFHSDLMIYDVKDYRLPAFSDEVVIYDAHFENQGLRLCLEKKYPEVVVDLYGGKLIEHEKRYMLSTQVLPYGVVKQYGLQLRPVELNVYMDVVGEGIYLYDLSKGNKKTKRDGRIQLVRKWNYFMKERFLMWNEIVPLCCEKAGNLLKVMRKNHKK